VALGTANARAAKTKIILIIMRMTFLLDGGKELGTKLLLLNCITSILP
jgi:hypothetical protein